MYVRHLNLPKLLDKKSVLLLGPRQTGKSTLVRDAFPGAHYINLAEADTFRELSARPELLRQRLPEGSSVVVVDEAQLLPEIFNEVQVLLDSRGDQLRVVLTGSSARKLRRGGVNLLPGRVWKRDLFPLVYPELGAGQVERRVIRGSLPAIFDSTEYREELMQYVGLYLQEEIRAEGLVRGVGDFSRFLTIAALSNAEQLNFTNVSNDTGVSLNTVRSYFEILEDTLIGRQLLPYRRTMTRKAVATPKFYFFDSGVVNALLNRFEVSPESDLFGKALEHLIFLELTAYLSYSGEGRQLTYWRSQSKIEVDFLIDDEVAIEVKATQRVTERDEKGLHALGEDLTLKRKILVCRERYPRRSEKGVEIWPVDGFLEQLWNGAFSAA